MPASFRLRPRRSRRGAPLIEAALLLPVLLLIVAGAMEFRRAFAVSAAVQTAARNAADSQGDSSQMQATVRQELQATLGLDESSVEVTAAIDSTATRHVQVAVPYRLVGSTLASLLPTAHVTGSAASSH